MTEGYTCDRCGDFTSDRVKVSGFSNTNVSDPTYRQIKIGYRYGESGFRSTTYDLCEECRKKLDAWVTEHGG